MKKIFITCLIILNFISNQPISIADKEFVILYFCDMNGVYDFDMDGRKGLATISEIKKTESKKFYDHRGQVFLISGGNFSGKGSGMQTHFNLLNKAGFDAAFIGEDELSYLEMNPALKNLRLPIIAERENSFDAIREKIIKSEGIQFRISHILPDVEDTNIDVQLLFKNGGSYDYLKTLDVKKPVYFFTNEDSNSAFSFKKNIYTVHCPSPDKLGKLNLFFRNKNLIRQKQEFIPLNTNDLNRSWIEPDREIVNELR